MYSFQIDTYNIHWKTFTKNGITIYASKYFTLFDDNDNDNNYQYCTVLTPQPVSNGKLLYDIELIIDFLIYINNYLIIPINSEFHDSTLPSNKSISFNLSNNNIMSIIIVLRISFKGIEGFKYYEVNMNDFDALNEIMELHPDIFITPRFVHQQMNYKFVD